MNPISIPAIDLGAGYRAHQEEIDQAIRRVLDGGWYILGREVAAFEEEFARFVGVEHCIGVGSGTDTLILALRAAGIGENDRVLTVSHTAVATVAAIELVGAVPVLVDVDPITYTIDPNRCEDTLLNTTSKRPKAMIPVHLYGHPADMPALMDIARRYELIVIEDCAQAHGASLDNRNVGTWGTAAAFSFYPTKNLGALGDGGAVATSDPKIADQVRSLRQYGWRERYISAIRGTNSRLDELQAAILRVRLTHLDGDNARRRALAQVYDQRLSDAKEVATPSVVSAANAVYHQYVIRSARRDSLQQWLKEQGIGTLIHYPVPVHMQPAYAGRVPLGAGGLPNTEKMCHEILSLPMYPQLSYEQAGEVGNRIVEWTRTASHVR